VEGIFLGLACGVLENEDFGSCGLSKEPSEDFFDGGSLNGHLASETVSEVSRLLLSILICPSQNRDQKVEHNNKKTIRFDKPDDPTVVDHSLSLQLYTVSVVMVL
jgi:hypothetical protein